MEYLKPFGEGWEPPKYRTKKYPKGFDNENLELLNNDEREEVTEDFSDSPFLK